MNFLNMIEDAVNGGQAPALADAAEAHVSEMPAEEVEQHLQTAASNADANGQPDVAQEIQEMIANKRVDPEELKSAAIDYLKANPQVISQFAPSFAQGIINRFL